MRNPWANIGLMMTGQGSSLATSMISISFAALIGASLAHDPKFATLPQALMLIATALTTGPISFLMGRWGRRFGFITGSVTGVIAVGIGVFAIMIGSFALFCLATFLLGTLNAAGQYYRFAAAESVPSQHAPKALSFVLLGGIIAALTVPFMTQLGETSLGLPQYGGAFAIAGLYAAFSIIPACLARFKPITVPPDNSTPKIKVPLIDIFKRRLFIMGVVTAAGAQALMNLLMTATPLAMAHAGHMAHHSTNVIQAHVIAMFLPSLISGWLITKLGLNRVVFAGLVSMLGSIVAARAGIGVGHFTLSLVLLGLGWNFLFVSGTTLITQSHREEERARVQGVNESVVFGSAAIAALTSGAILDAIGWYGLAASSLSIVILIAAVNVTGVIQARRQHPAE